jgi:hypothetical protein
MTRPYLPNFNRHPRLTLWLGYEALLWFQCTLAMIVPQHVISFWTLGSGLPWAKEHDRLSIIAAAIPALAFRWLGKRIWPNLDDPARLDTNERRIASALQARLARISVGRLLLAYLALILAFFFLRPWGTVLFRSITALFLWAFFLVSVLKRRLPHPPEPSEGLRLANE